jgi:hypothetical protein
MPIGMLLLTAVAPAVVEQIGKTCRRWLKERAAQRDLEQRLSALERRVGELEAGRRWSA